MRHCPPERLTQQPFSSPQPSTFSSPVTSSAPAMSTLVTIFLATSRLPRPQVKRSCDRTKELREISPSSHVKRKQKASSKVSMFTRLAPRLPYWKSRVTSGSSRTFTGLPVKPSNQSPTKRQYENPSKNRSSLRFYSSHHCGPICHGARETQYLEPDARGGLRDSSCRNHPDLQRKGRAGV